MRKINTIESRGRKHLLVTLSDGEYFEVFQFGGEVYTSVSDGILKSTLCEFKKDVKQFDFDEKQLKKLWI